MKRPAARKPKLTRARVLRRLMDDHDAKRGHTYRPRIGARWGDVHVIMCVMCMDAYRAAGEAT